MKIVDLFRSFAPAFIKTKPADLIAFEQARERSSNGAACVSEQADILGNLVRSIRGRKSKRRNGKSGKPK